MPEVAEPPVVPEWMQTFPEELQKDPVVAAFKEPVELAKAYREAKQPISKKGVSVPDSQKSTPEEWQKFYNDLGRPEKPEGYKLSEVKDLHPSVKITPESKSACLSAAHQAVLRPEQVDGLNKWYLGTITAALKQQDAANADFLKQRQTELRS